MWVSHSSLNARTHKPHTPNTHCHTHCTHTKPHSHIYIHTKYPLTYKSHTHTHNTHTHIHAHIHSHIHTHTHTHTHKHLDLLGYHKVFALYQTLYWWQWSCSDWGPYRPVLRAPWICYSAWTGTVHHWTDPMCPLHPPLEEDTLLIQSSFQGALAQTGMHVSK